MATCNQDLQYGTEIQFFLGRQGIDKRGTKKSGQWFILLIICYERENIKFTNPPGGQCLYIHELADCNFLDMPLSILVCW